MFINIINDLLVSQIWKFYSCNKQGCAYFLGNFKSLVIIVFNNKSSRSFYDQLFKKKFIIKTALFVQANTETVLIKENQYCVYLPFQL